MRALDLLMKVDKYGAACWRACHWTRIVVHHVYRLLWTPQ